MYDDDVICASFCKLIRANDKLSSWYLVHYLENSYKEEVLSTFEVQSTGISNFKFTDFKKHHNILMPDSEVLRKFYELTYKIYRKRISMWKQNQNLITQRDLLLPRLMNGSIKVK